MPNNVVSVVIPAYNEEKTIGRVIEEIIQVMESLGFPYEIIVIDDGSEDCTKEVAGKYKVTILSNGKNMGKGYALRKGFQQASGNIIVTIDADGSHRPKEIPDLINALLDGADIVAGSRFLGKDKDHTSKLHVFGNYLINMAIIVLTGKMVTDSQTGLRALKRELLQSFSLESQGYEIETEITVKGLKNGFVFKEIPISCDRRRNGVSRLNALYQGPKILRTILKHGAVPKRS
ncbi:MAG: glycosyltransferase family 2 protein [Candidatus Bathyarchaeota archaeon]|jgi:glycosyltransferase involved in cell wall biosynthesis|nr:glycosyltransferase family 2 protein [Candidatus Bathyarchaeota archaeon]